MQLKQEVEPEPGTKSANVSSVSELTEANLLPD